MSIDVPGHPRTSMHRCGPGIGMHMAPAAAAALVAALVPAPAQPWHWVFACAGAGVSARALAGAFAPACGARVRAHNGTLAQVPARQHPCGQALDPYTYGDGCGVGFSAQHIPKKSFPYDVLWRGVEATPKGRSCVAVQVRAPATACVIAPECLL